MATLVGKQAPNFTSSAVVNGHIVNNFTLSQYLGKYVILFFYPLNFTFVCPTELHAFQEKLAAFSQRNTQVIGCSVDSSHSHFAWLNTPKNKGGIEGIEYPLLSDMNKSISSDYDVLVPEAGIAYRGLFLIDKTGRVRHQVINDLPLGRSVEEALRILDALIHFEQHGEVCPANWNQGKQSMKATREGVEEYFTAFK